VRNHAAVRARPPEASKRHACGRASLGFAALVAALLLAAPSPAPARPTGAGGCATRSYRVHAGDTLYSIARRFGTTVRAIATANRLDPNGILRIGLVLKIPRPGCTPAAPDRPAATAPPVSLSSALTKALRRRGSPLARTAAVVVDLRSGETLYALHAGEPMAPASTEKLPLALAALQLLGPSFPISTEVRATGALDGAVWNGDLYLKGYGDPTLSTRGLGLLARQLHARGIRRIAGRLYADETFFDGERTGVGWKPEFYKVESPPLGALVADRAVIDGHVSDRPALAAAIVFRRALGRVGIQADGLVALGEAPAGAVRLAAISSPPVSRLLSLMETWSDNFVAELLLKQLGARVAVPGSAANGVRLLTETLAADGIPEQGVVLDDGSGLSLADRLTAGTLAAILVYAARQPALEPLLRGLAIAGRTGTLRNRLKAVPDHRLVRGKTGSTDESSALAGVVGNRFAFAVLENGDPVDFAAAHAAQDGFLTLLLRAATTT